LTEEELKLQKLRQQMERRRKEQEQRKLKIMQSMEEKKRLAQEKKVKLAKQRAVEAARQKKKMEGLERTKALKKVVSGETVDDTKALVGSIFQKKESEEEEEEEEKNGNGGGGLVGAIFQRNTTTTTSTKQPTIITNNKSKDNKKSNNPFSGIISNMSSKKDDSKKQPSSSSSPEEEGNQTAGWGDYLSGVATGIVQKTIRSYQKRSNVNPNEEWIVVCPKIAVAPGVTLPVVAGGLDLLLVVSKDGKRLSCLANTCPHLGTPLETGLIERRPRNDDDGILKGGQRTTPITPPPTKNKGNIALANNEIDDGCEDCIVCPLHQTAFALESGEVRGEWCPYPPVIGKVMGTVKAKSKLPTFKVRTRGKNVEVLINSSLDEEAGDNNDVLDNKMKE